MADNYIPTTFSLGLSKKKPGWHSVRHETNFEQRNARIHYETTRGAKNRVETANERIEARLHRSTPDQLELIEKRTAAGKGESKKEKARLLARLEKEKSGFVLTPSMETLAQVQSNSVNSPMQKKHYQRTKRS